MLFSALWYLLREKSRKEEVVAELGGVGEAEENLEKVMERIKSLP